VADIIALSLESLIVTILGTLVGVGKLETEEGQIAIVFSITVLVAYLAYRFWDLRRTAKGALESARQTREKLGDKDEKSVDARIDESFQNLKDYLTQNSAGLENVIKLSQGASFVPRERTIPWGQVLHSDAGEKISAMWTFDWGGVQLDRYFETSLRSESVKKGAIQVERIIAHVPLRDAKKHIGDFKDQIAAGNYSVFVPKWRSTPIVVPKYRDAMTNAVVPRIEMIISDYDEAMLIFPGADKRSAGAGIHISDKPLVDYLYDLYEWFRTQCDVVNKDNIDDWLKAADENLRKSPGYLLV